MCFPYSSKKTLKEILKLRIKYLVLSKKNKYFGKRTPINVDIFFIINLY